MPDSSKIFIFATLVAAPGRGPALRLALEPLVAATRQEPGNLQYDLYEPLDAPGTFFVYESYRDSAAVEAHMSSPHFNAAMAEAGPLLGSPPQITQARQIL